MIAKCKNPYYDTNINKKFVFLLNSVLLSKGIYLQDGATGLFIDNNIVGALDSQLDYEMAIYKELSVYEVFSKCIPEGMRYNKELDKLVPYIISPDTIADKFNKAVKIGEDNHSFIDTLAINLSTKFGCSKDDIYTKLASAVFDGVPLKDLENKFLSSLEANNFFEDTKKEFCDGIDLKSDVFSSILENKDLKYGDKIRAIKNVDFENKKDITPSYYGEKCLCGRKIDWYVIGDLYNKGKGSAWDHAGKKLLRAGEGHKNLKEDILEVIDSLNRWLEQINDREQQNVK